MPTNLIAGSDAANTLTGTGGADLLYGFDPNGPQGTVTSIAAERVATGLSQPLFAVAPPGDQERLFIVEKTGDIKILMLDTGQVLSTSFLDVSAEIDVNGERGLLGLAFDPDYATDGFIYVNLINTAGDTEIRRYHVSADPNVVDTASMQLVLTVDQPSATNHKGGWLAFGPDGYLYASLGDGGATSANAQNADNLLGKILRLDVSGDAFPGDATRNYAIPGDNPFVGVAGADEIYALGLRNPWRPSFDRGLEGFMIADVGQNAWEEIDVGQRGANYGWPTYEGPVVFSSTQLGPGTLTTPIYSYNHSVGQAITGGYVYRGQSEGLQGHYFFADFSAGKIFTLRFDGSSWVATERTAQVHPDVGAINSPSSFGEDALGNLYLVDYDGDVFRLTPTVSSADQGDTLSGGGGDDMVFGGSGNDTLQGGAGNDALYGQAGEDTASYAAASGAVLVDLALGTADDGQGGRDILASIEDAIGSAFADTLVGSAAANVLQGGDGDDNVYGGDGNDTLIGWTGIDYLGGEAGDDRVSGNDGNDTLVGGLGDDTQWGDAGDDRVSGNDGNDWLEGGPGNDFLWGDIGSDTLIGGIGTDWLEGGDGDDRISGNEDGDTIVAGVGNDSAWGDAGDDHISGNDGADRLEGLSGNDTIWGDAGGDTITGGIGADWLEGGDGDDRISGNEDGDTIVGGDGADFAWGDAGNDAISGGIGDDQLDGGDGDDRAWGDAGNDTLIGGVGNDRLEGLDGDDRLSGNDGTDVLIGGTGNDMMWGDAGADRLTGGAGADTMTGGADADEFIYLGTADSLPGANDVINDFQRGLDQIDFSGIDADSLTAGDQAFTFIGTGAFTAAGQLRIVVGSNEVTIEANVDGNTAADFSVRVLGVTTLDNTDWIL